VSYDFKTHRWTFDINSFNRYKTMFQTVAHYKGDWAERHREHIRKNMRDIQQRWPQFIKLGEIP
jgi:hypothetical protein